VVIGLGEWIVILPALVNWSVRILIGLVSALSLQQNYTRRVTDGYLQCPCLSVMLRQEQLAILRLFLDYSFRRSYSRI